MDILETKQEDWEYAQKLELRTWIMSDELGVNNDDNDWWYQQFDEYKCLPSHIKSAIELGSGPYTNMRYFIQGREIDTIHCSDPLMYRYLRLRNAWVASAFNHNVVSIDSNSIEKLHDDHIFPSESFELVIMINVLDHVKDATKCIEEAIRLTSKYIIIGQTVSDNFDIVRLGRDPMHPIRIHHSTIEKNIETKFKTIFKKILNRFNSRNYNHYGTYLYIGEKNDSL